MKFDYEQINLVPNKCIVDSRSECDTSVKLGKNRFRLPVMPANMECVINEHIARMLSENNYFYVLHRFNIDMISFLRSMNKDNLITSISIGVNDDSYKLINDICAEELHVDYITIDIAHGHAIKMEKMIKYLKHRLPNTFIIAGNVSSVVAVRDLESWGADAIKVGIGPGCFIPTSIVKTKRGDISLNDIKIGDLVLTHTNKYNKVLEKHIYTKEQSLIRINDLPPSTLNHEYFVINKEDKEVVNETNILDYGYWVAANILDKTKHLLIKY